MKKNKEKVLYIGNFELPDKNAAAHRVISNAQLFSELGYETIFVGVSKETKQIKQERMYVDDEYEINVYNRAYPNTFFEWMKFSYYVKDIKKIFVENDSIKFVVLYNVPLIVSIRLLRFFKKKKIKVLGDITEWYPNIWKSLRNIVLTIDMHFRMKWINKKYDGLILISKYLYEYYTKTNKILIPPLVDINHKKWEIHDFKNENEKIKIIYFGNPGNKEDLTIILELIQQKHIKSTFDFHIFGVDKPKECNTTLNNNIFYHGYRNHIYVIDYLKKCDFSIFLRKKSRATDAGFPTKLVESLSAGIPVITNESSNITDYVVDGKNGFILKSDIINELEKVLIKISNMSEDELNDMKINTLEEKLFYYKNYIQEFKQFIEKV